MQLIKAHLGRQGEDEGDAPATANVEDSNGNVDAAKSRADATTSPIDLEVEILG